MRENNLPWGSGRFEQGKLTMPIAKHSHQSAVGEGVPSVCCARARDQGEPAKILVTGFTNNSPGGDEWFEFAEVFLFRFLKLRKRDPVDGHLLDFRGVEWRNQFTNSASADHLSAES